MDSIRIFDDSES